MCSLLINLIQIAHAKGLSRIISSKEKTKLVVFGDDFFFPFSPITCLEIFLSIFLRVILDVC